MTHWETIQDHSSHISPAKVTQQKNHSAVRGKEIFSAVVKSSIPTKSYSLTSQPVKKSKQKTKFTTKSILIFLLFIVSISLFWSCFKSENNACIRVDTAYYTQKIQDTQSLVTTHVTQPFVSNVKTVWTNLTLEEFVYTPYRSMHNYYKTSVLPILNSLNESLQVYAAYWLKELDNYINENAVYETSSEDSMSDSIIDEKIKKTARNILNYIDLSQNTGMQQGDAKEKAQKIIQSITQETNFS